MLVHNYGTSVRRGELEKLRVNLASLTIRLTPEQFRVLDESSTPAPIHPYLGFTE